MTKSRYRLQTVLGVRERAKQAAARTVAQRREQVAEAERELARREGELARCRARQREAREAMFGEARTGAEARRMVEHRTHLADLRAQEETLAASVEEQRAAVARAERELDVALDALAEAAKEFRVIEKHKENWRESERVAARRREQKVSDEVAALLRRTRDE
ncbi:MAG TPA: flagellar FliJ family protein [Pyrinomonadaceae bacterium]|nr:flagellar FliJ family protein [Pyrinomonadaceae bacterium]